MAETDPTEETGRCGKDKRHTPHWWGMFDNIWCDGRVYRPFVPDAEQVCKCGTEESAHNSVDPPHMFVPQ